MIELEVGVATEENTHFDSKGMLTLAKSSAPSASATVVLGVAIFVPFDGKFLLLRNGNRSAESGEGVNIEINVIMDDTCSIFTPTPLVSEIEQRDELDEAAQSKPKDRLSYMEDKNTASNAKSKNLRGDDEGDSSPMLGFDLRIFHPSRGEFKHTDNAENYSKTENVADVDSGALSAMEVMEMNRNKIVTPAVIENKFQIRESVISRDFADKSDNESLSESIVTGDSHRSNIRIDRNFYSYAEKTGILQIKPQVEGGELEHRIKDDFSVVSDISIRGKGLSQLLGSAMNVKLGQTKPGPSEPSFIGVPSDALNLKLAQRTTIPTRGNEYFVRDISRGAKSRLNRHGIQDINYDSSYQQVGQHGAPFHRRPIDMKIEELQNDAFVQEINIQFVGFRRKVGVLSDLSDSLTYSPRAIYFTFQFYTCAPTRTESLKLLPSNAGEINVLTRDDPEVRGEPPLSLRFIIDFTMLSPMESIEFSQYLSQKSLYVDVWDSDALLQIGTFGIPLRMLMRQGAPSIKQSVECDVINAEIAALSEGGITSLVIMENGPVSGEIVGSVGVILSNVGSNAGSGPNRSLNGNGKNAPYIPIEGLNWRAHGVDSTTSAGTTSHRPKNLVLAKPLSEKSPELSKALVDLREHSNGVSFRSLASARGANGNSTLNYDEVVLIFKRFQGNVKGTVQYLGDLMLLLDLPSLAVVTKKLIKAFRAHTDSTAFKMELLRFSNASEEMKIEDLQECFRNILQSMQIKVSTEELILLCQKLFQDLSHSENTLNTKISSGVRAKQIVEYIQREADRLEWIRVQSHFQLCAQNAELQGVDVHEMLSEFDVQNSSFISIRNFRDFLVRLSTFGKLTVTEITLMCRYFCGRSRDPNSTHNAHELEDNREPVSLKEVMATLGKEYSGNVQKRIQLFLSKQFVSETSSSKDELVDFKYILRLLNQGDMKNVRYYYSVSDIEGLFKSLGLYTQLSHSQVHSIINKMDAKKNQQIPITSILNYLGVLYKAADLPSHFIEKSPDLATNVQIDAEYLLRLLLEKVQTLNVAVDQAFRHFDTNGDGQITTEELQSGLRKLGIFDHIPNWELQIPQIVKKFDTSGDGTVSIKEFFQFLGIKDYSPNIIQKLTRIFTIALQKGVSFKAIFMELDENKNGSIDTQELITGCKKLGAFQEITIDDANMVVNEFDKNSDGQISLEEFINFFSLRIEQFQKSTRAKNFQRVIKRFRDVITTARDRGGITIRDIFAHLDKDKGGSVSIQELSQGLRALPNFKSLSDQDIQDLTAAIDFDKSGDITADEFERFIIGDSNKVEISTKPDETSNSIVDRTREIFVAAKSNGVSFEKLFSLMDRDKSDSLSLKELDDLLHRIPSFKQISSHDVRVLFDYIDTDQSGLISLKEFEQFIESGTVRNVATKAKTVINEPIRDESKNSEPNRDDKKRNRPTEEVRELFLRHMRRISEIDGSVRALLAYLDDDEDGLITKSRLFNLLRREQVFESFSEDELQTVLLPCYYQPNRSLLQQRGSDVESSDKIDIGALLRLLEGQKPLYNVQKDYLEEDEALNYKTKDYQFSNNIELKLVEKKLRSFGRSLAKKGIDVEKEFQKYDPKLGGFISRTDFIKVLSKLGIYLLEEGKVLKEEGCSGNAEDSSTIRKLQQQQIKRLKGFSDQGQSYVQDIPKLARKVFQFDYKNGSEFKNHLESLTIIDWYRQGQKQMLLQNVLSHSLMHTISLYPRFGKTLFFEYAVHNPFNHEERFEIEIGDPELRLVTSYEEWLFLRKSCRSCVGELGTDPVEAEMFDRDGTGNVQVTLLPNEILYIPFTYMSLIPFSPGQQRNAVNGRNVPEKSSTFFEPYTLDSDTQKRSIDVKIVSATHGHIVAVLNVQLNPFPFIINRVLRFQEFENVIAKRRIQLVGIPNDSVNYPAGATRTEMKFVHCVENTRDLTENQIRSAAEMSRVAVEWGSDQYNEGEMTHSLNLLIRYRCMEATGMGMFYLLIYNDPYQCQLHEVWQVIIHSRLRLDIHGIIGSGSVADLVLRGDQHPRRVRSFASAYSPAQKISFKPESIFQLIPGAYNRVVMNIQPKQLGSYRALVNIVDVDSRVLLSSWLISIHAQAPAVMRIYDVEVSVGNVLYKKILFKNLWDCHRKYTLMSSDEQLMRARTNSVEIGPQGATYLRLWFNEWPNNFSGIKEVYLFLNDQETGQNEECNLFRIRQAL